MSSVLQQERDRLSQEKTLAWLNQELPATELLTVYLSDYQPQHNYGIYCALIPTQRIQESLATPTWDLSHGQGLPGACMYSGEKGESCVEYLRYGVWHVEPLVIEREFHGIRDDYLELSEEFRHFHELYHDGKSNEFLKIEDDGTETLVAKVEDTRVRVRLKELRQFLAVKEMHLALQFDCREHSASTLQQLGVKEESLDHRTDLACWSLNYGDFSGMGGENISFSRLFGKRLIQPLPKDKSGLWGFSKEVEKKFEEFIIKVDEHGDNVSFTSDPDVLADYFGGNPGAPHYLTPVHFRKSVLDKYYHQPGKYTVDDSILRCGSLWSIRIDNHHNNKVCAWLGDLGRDLPHSEQLHWRSYNMPPSGKLSDTFVRRQLHCESAKTNRPELIFHEYYHTLARECRRTLGWQLLLPLSERDSHYFKGIRVPSTDDQKEFDEVVLGLTKILIDSLNEKDLIALISLERV